MYLELASKKVESGDFIKIEFTGRVKGSDVVFATSDEEVAKKFNIFDEKTRYGPIPLVAGQSFLLAGLDKQIVGLPVGEQKTVQVPFIDAYGPKREDLIKTYPQKKLKDSNIKIVKGEHIKDKNRTGVITQWKEGKVWVDFNHELAGQDLEFEVKVLEKVDDLKSKLLLLVNRYVPVKEEDFKFESKSEKDISLELSPYLLLTEGLQNVTLRMISDLRSNMGYDKIEFKFAFDFTEVNKEEKKFDELISQPVEEKTESSDESEEKEE